MEIIPNIGSKCVCVLMSTFNGSLYIEQQVNSIINQNSVDIQLIIRDDGSSDGTRSILKRVAEQYANVEIIYGDNIGIVSSFSYLVKYAYNKNYDYFAFADQDDVWLEDKISRSFNKLSIEDIPVVYYSNLIITDAELKHMGNVYNQRIRVNYKKGSMVRNYAYGCTMVFNRKAARLYINGIGARMWMHDYWMNLIGTFLGECIYDPEPTILYRQHSNNSVGVKHSLINNIKNKYVTLKKYKEHPRENMMYDFLKIYNNEIHEADKQTITDFISYRKNILNRIKASLDSDYRMYDGFTQLFLIIRFLIGNV